MKTALKNRKRILTATATLLLSISSLILFVCSSSSSGTQLHTDPPLTKGQMLADFDTLAKIIREVNPQINLRKMVMGLDIPAELARLRQQVDTCRTDASFHEIVRQALAVCQDSHGSIMSNWFFEEFTSAQQKEHLALFAGNAVTERGITVTQRYSKHMDSVFNSIKLNIPLAYIAGDYYTVSAFRQKNREFPAGLKVVAFNGTDVHSFVQRLYREKRLRWDMARRRFYDEHFYLAFSLASAQALEFVFEKPDGKKLTASFAQDAQKNAKPNDTKPQKKIRYFEADKILYIRVPEMATADSVYYAEQVKSLYRNKPINKVVIDIRGNWGGSDMVGINLLKALIGETVSTEVILAGKQNSYATKRLKNASLAQITIPCLNNETFAVWHEWQDITQPDPNSIGFNGNIYILQDNNIYSAAGTLAAFARYSDKIVSVGQSTGRLLGRGIDPMVFMLPHSGLIFCLEPVLDINGIKTAQEAFRDDVEIPVPLSVKDFRNRVEYTGDVYAEDFLYRLDPVFQRVLLLP